MDMILLLNRQALLTPKMETALKTLLRAVMHATGLCHIKNNNNHVE